MTSLTSPCWLNFLLRLFFAELFSFADDSMSERRERVGIAATASGTQIQAGSMLLTSGYRIPRYSERSLNDTRSKTAPQVSAVPHYGYL